MRRAITFALGSLIGAAAVLLPRLSSHLRLGSADALRAHAEATFRFTAEAPLERVAPLFGADGERAWAPGWEPRFLHPSPARDREGMVFTVRHGHGESVWVNTRFDLAAGVVQYVYVVPDLLTTLVTLRLTPEGARTHVQVTYERTALSAQGDARVRQLSARDANAGPEWAQQIGDYLRKAAAADPDSSVGSRPGPTGPASAPLNRTTAR